MALPASASQLSLEPSLDAEGDRWLSVWLDTEGKKVNAIEFQATFSPENVQIWEIAQGNSLLSFWLQQPSFSNETGIVSFSGIIPGGFEGRGVLLELKVVPQGQEVISFVLENTRVLLHDGQGTQDPVNSTIIIAPSAFSAAAVRRNPAEGDRQPPEPFNLFLGHDVSLWDSRYFVSFSTVDKGTGIDYYEVMEVVAGKDIPPDSRWERVQSPYLLKDQSLRKDVYVRAVDREGNFVVAKLPAQSPQGTSRKWWALLGLPALIVVIRYRRALNSLFS